GSAGSAPTAARWSSARRGSRDYKRPCGRRCAREGTRSISRSRPWPSGRGRDRSACHLGRSVARPQRCRAFRVAHSGGRLTGVDLLAFRDAADALGVRVTRVHQLVRDGQLVAVRDEEGHKCVPALLIRDGAVVKWLPSVITMLRDAHYADHEIVDW